MTIARSGYQTTVAVTVFEFGDVMTLRKLDEDFVVLPLGGVILAEFRPQPPGLNAHYSVTTGIEGLIPSKDFGRYRVFFGLRSGVFQGGHDDVSEKCLEQLALFEDMALADPLDLLLEFLI